MSVVVDFQPKLRVTQTIDAADAPLAVGVGSASVPYDISANGRFSSADTPYPTVCLGNEYTLTSGSPTTLDLTAMPTLENVSVNGTANGLQLLFMKWVCDPANTGTVTVEPGASNPYPIMGASGLKVFQPGEVQENGFKKKADGTMPAMGQIDVDSTHKTVKLSTNVTGTKVKVMLIFG